MDAESRITQFIRDSIAAEGRAVGPDTRLFEEGIIDSMTLAELLTFLEDQFEIRIGPMDITPDHFGSVRKIVNYLQKK